MKRPAVHTTVLPLVLAVSLLSHVSDCSRPSMDEPRIPSVPHPVVVLRGDELHQHRHDDDASVEVEGAEGRTTRVYDDDAAVPSVTTASARGEDDQGGVVARSVHWSASSSRSRPPQLRSKLARRVLAGPPPVEGAETRASSSRSPPLLRSKLAMRRVLAGAPPGEGAADSAARSSCGSSDVHNGCPPHH